VRGPPEAGEETSGRWQKGTSGTALCQDPMRAMAVPSPYWPVSPESRSSPQRQMHPPCVGVELARSQRYYQLATTHANTSRWVTL
jgi:hypothetical protein